MAKRYKAEMVTGGASATVQGSGISSTAEEPKTIDAVHLFVTGQAGNRILAFLERDEVLDIPDYLVATDEDLGAANFPRVTNRQSRFELGHSIPVGQTFLAAIACGLTNKDLWVVYEYTIRTGR